MGEADQACALSLAATPVCLQRDGNVLMSYNNRPATDSIPFLSPFLVRNNRIVNLELWMLAWLLCCFDGSRRMLLCS